MKNFVSMMTGHFVREDDTFMTICYGAGNAALPDGG